MIVKRPKGRPSNEQLAGYERLREREEILALKRKMMSDFYRKANDLIEKNPAESRQCLQAAQTLERELVEIESHEKDVANTGKLDKTQTEGEIFTKGIDWSKHEDAEDPGDFKWPMMEYDENNDLHFNLKVEGRAGGISDQVNEAEETGNDAEPRKEVPERKTYPNDAYHDQKEEWMKKGYVNPRISLDGKPVLRRRKIVEKIREK